MSRALHGQSSSHVPRRTLKRPVRAVGAGHTSARPMKHPRRLSSVFSVSPSPEPATNLVARGRADHASVARRRRRCNRSQTIPDKSSTPSNNSGECDSVIQHAAVLLEAVEQASVQGQLNADAQAITVSQRSTAVERILEQHIAGVQEPAMLQDDPRQPLMGWQRGIIKRKMPLSIKDLLRTPSPPRQSSLAGTVQEAPLSVTPRRERITKSPTVEERMAELQSTDETRSNVSLKSKAEHSWDPTHQPLAVYRMTAMHSPASRQQAATNEQTVNQRAPAKLVSKQQAASQQLASECVDISDRGEAIASDFYAVSYIDNPGSLRGYVIQRSPSAPCSFPEWSDAQRLHTLDDGTNVYELGGIAYIDLELEDQHLESCPASLARIVDMRDLGCDGGEKDSSVIFLVAWFNTRHDVQRYPHDWSCKNMSAWPKGKTHVLTTRLQLVDLGAVGDVLGPRGKRGWRWTKCIMCWEVGVSRG